MILRELLHNIEYLECNADFDTDILDICYDSRKAATGMLFVAVKGFETDGHKYINKAYENGCRIIVCEVKPDFDIQYVLVKDSRLALALLSCNFFGNPAKQLKMIGVTGTSGKTTSTQLIKFIIEYITGKKVGLIGTNGNFIGDVEYHTEHTTPESYDLQKLLRQMCDSECEYVVMEVSSHALYLDRVAGINFDVAAYTNLSQDHLDFHKDMDDYASVKKTLFKSMCGIACINIDDSYASFITDGLTCKLFTTSAKSRADVSASDITLSSKGVSFNASFKNQKEFIELSIPGEFSVYNALTSISVCLALGLSLRDIGSAISKACGVKGRMELLDSDGDYSIIIDYSHKPDALEKVLKTLRPITSGRLIVLFGCGGDRDKIKRPIMGRIAVTNADISIITSDNPRTERPEDIIDDIVRGIPDSDDSYVVIPDRVQAIAYAIDIARDGDIVLLAGKGHEDYQVIGHEKHHMDEREIVADILKERKA